MLTSSFPRFKGDFAGVFVAEAAEILNRQCPITVLAPNDARVDPDYRPGGMNILRFGAFLPGSWSPFYGDGAPENLQRTAPFLMAPVALADMLRLAGPNARRSALLISHWMVPAGLVGALLRSKNRPLQLFVHGSDWHLLKASLPGRRMARFILRRSDDVIAVAACLRDEMLTLFGGGELERMAGRIRVAPMGLHIDRYAGGKPLATNKPEVLALGRLVPIKGFDRLIRAMRGLDARLIVAGDGPQSGELKKLAVQNKLTSRFLGKVSTDKIAALYHRAAVLAIPSRKTESRGEGSPRVALEGMAAGCALCVSASGGLETLIEHERTGLLDFHDNRHLRANLKRLLTTPDLRRDLSRRAAESVTAYDWSRLAPQYMAPFQEVFTC